MRPVVVVVADVLDHEPLEMPFVEYDDVIERVPAATPDEAFRDSVLMINLRKSGRTSVPGSRVRSHFAVRRDFSPGCRRASFGSQSSKNPTSTDSNPRK